MNKNQIQQFVENNPNLVSRRATSFEDVFVLKYSKRVFYDSLWTEELEKCRGTLVDSEYNLVSMPFDKIYNLGIEESAPKISDDTLVTAYRKVNGFMVAVTSHKNQLIVSTTGSTDSNFVELAKKYIDIDNYTRVCKLNSKYTFLFECVAVEDPHIINEQPGMYLLGYRKKTWNSQVEYDTSTLIELSKEFNCQLPEVLFTTLGKLKQIVKVVEHEGFVGYTEKNVAFKIKSPYYLTKKWLMRSTKSFDNYRQRVDEEYYPLCQHIIDNYTEYSLLNEQERRLYIEQYFLTQIPEEEPWTTNNQTPTV